MGFTENSRRIVSQDENIDFASWVTRKLSYFSPCLNVIGQTALFERRCWKVFFNPRHCYGNHFTH
jgi:hypothetical protein